ncbi:Probable amino-acid permease protein yxeN [Nocardia otitidiscaviarum]|uniref:Probable amino-acid permease protein yxeN n=1 Tax=Nocardia otitidiscaviarum TaxID=1823 RepID=A0A379JGI1_9NOCA|nr:ectoine/hydroxyectoine ABC transporter permease subunit EhuD [Nocardia otitidiscaviarum]MBF6236602.1 ectoine/hydroxyectoine ABC transporter permease subunit EhuD [Nocardia otitidiscaviarum]SUD47570.1 Probable amino-acid permease protein yxeN [Nocardia otitidiscaviarum]
MEKWQWDRFFDAFPYILDGLKVTIQFTLLGSLVAYTLGLLFAVIGRLGIPVVTQALWLFIEFVRSTPLLVQIFVLYWVVRPPLLGELPIETQRLLVGVAALGVHYACYTSEVYRAGIDAVPRAQWEAATALNLPRTRTWTDVVLPQAIPRVLPALGNYTIAMFKEVPLLSSIVVLDMVYQVKTVYAANTGGAGPEAWFAVGLTFLMLSYPCSLLVRKLERRVGSI